MVKTKYGIFRNGLIVGRVVYFNIDEAQKECDSWNEQFKRFNEQIKINPLLTDNKPIEMVEVKEYRKKRQTAEQKLKEMVA